MPAAAEGNMMIVCCYYIGTQSWGWQNRSPVNGSKKQAKSFKVCIFGSNVPTI